MKYGEQLEHESVPQWSLHNLDYNSLKHEIKAHTSRDQATAICIPGREDTALRKFEEGLYLELCRQHDRVDLFISSKADEITRRLASLSRSIYRWIAKLSNDDQDSNALKQQRRAAKYERELHRIDDEIHSLSRFANAQVIAFRKIIKKYKKWTGSTTLGSRFNEEVLSNPKSFTHRDFKHLQLRHDEVLTTLRNATPQLSEPSSPSTDGGEPSTAGSRPTTSAQHLKFEPLPPASRQLYHQRQASHHSSQVKYWNEYDDGSEAGGPEDDYAIYVNPDESTTFPGLGYVQAVLSLPYEKVKTWFRIKRSGEQEPLLPSSRPPTRGYSTVGESDEEGYASSSDFPTAGYMAHYAFPSITDQKVTRYRENVLFWGTIGSFVASFALMAISGVLISTGRHKLRVEVDAAVTVGVAMSLLCACSGLAMTLYRKDPLRLSYQLMVGSAFIASCLLNSMLLILVVGNAP